MFGLSLGAITDEARKEFSIDASVEGVLVTAVEPGSEAEEKSVKPGEVIVQVSQTDVTEPSQVVKRIDELKKEGRRTVMLLVSGADKKLRFVSLRIEERRSSSRTAPSIGIPPIRSRGDAVGPGRARPSLRRT